MTATRTSVATRRLTSATSAALLVALAAALPAGATARPGAPAAPSAPTSSLTWKVSENFVSHFSPSSFAQSTLVANDGATLDSDQATTFSGGTGWSDPSGAAHVEYEGTLTGSFVIGGTTHYEIAISDPAVTTTADGTGTLTADVDWRVPGESPSAGGADDVVVTTFDANGAWNGATLSATPAWEGVVPAGGADAQALGLPQGRPTDGGSFAPELLSALPTSLRAHFYASGSRSDARKSPSPITATAPAPMLTATTSSTSKGLQIHVEGSGYSPVEPGVYVGLTTAGPIDSTNATSYHGTIWLSGRAIGDDGAFNEDLELITPAQIDGLDPDASYEIHTQKAHGRSSTDPSQNVRLPVDIDFDGLAGTTMLTAGSVTTTYGARATLTATAPGADGPGTVVIGGRWLRGTFTDGSATFALPTDLRAGHRTARVKFNGSTSIKAAETTTTVTIRSATTSTRPLWVSTKPSSTSTGKGSVQVTNTSTTSPGARGKATITFTKGSTTKTLVRTVRYGKVTGLTIPHLAKGTWKVKVAFAGESGAFASSKSASSSLKIAR